MTWLILTNKTLINTKLELISSQIFINEIIEDNFKMF
jgi:hypothetical protein